MTQYSKYNVIYRLQKWLDSVPGQTFMNYAYSWGASVVILGALFKLTHLPGANFMLYFGMGIEAIVFFISGFDRPFDKTEEGRELPRHVNLDGDGDAEETSVRGGVQGGGTIIIGGGSGSGNVAGGVVGTGDEAARWEGKPAAAVGGGVVGGNWVAQQQEDLPGMAEAQGNYVEELNKLTEMIQKVSEQSQRLTRDSEEMENLNRTLTGICKVYEMQLKGASQQIGTIDEINEQTRKMALQIAELNKIYTRMIEAMTVNMPKAAMPPLNAE